jgi:hypothetical protein
VGCFADLYEEQQKLRLPNKGAAQSRTRDTVACPTLAILAWCPHLQRQRHDVPVEVLTAQVRVAAQVFHLQN